MNPLPPGLQDHVESICARGCNHVREVIRRLETDQPPPELAGLDTASRRLVLAELRAIMAVYDER